MAGNAGGNADNEHADNEHADNEHGAEDGQPGQSGRHDRDLHEWDRELGGYGYRPGDQPDPRSPAPPSSRSMTIYFVMMGTCLGLCAIAWAVVSRYSTVAAVIMSVAALMIPPFAAIIANSSGAKDRRRPLPAKSALAATRRTEPVMGLGPRVIPRVLLMSLFVDMAEIKQSRLLTGT